VCTEDSSYFDKENSSYYDAEEGSYTLTRLIQPVIKAGIVFPIAVSLLYAALFGWAIGLNIGLIFSEYTASAIFFVCTLFYSIYGQKVTVLDIIGLSLIVISVFDISVLGEWEREKEDTRPDDPNAPIDRTEEHKDLAISVGLAILAGLFQAFTALQINYIEKNQSKMDQVQVIIDSLLLVALGLAPFFVMEMLNEDPENPTYDMRQVLLCNLALVFDYIGQIFYALALKYGRAGRVQAIESFQGIPTVILAIIFLNQMPNIFEDVGLGISLLGLLVIAVQKN